MAVHRFVLSAALIVASAAAALPLAGVWALAVPLAVGRPPAVEVLALGEVDPDDPDLSAEAEAEEIRTLCGLPRGEVDDSARLVALALVPGAGAATARGNPGVRSAV